MFVEVVSPEESCFSGDATMVISRTPNGEIGILEGHEQTVATLMPGGLTIEHDNTRTSFAISGGILQITGDLITYLIKNQSIRINALVNQLLIWFS